MSRAKIKKESMSKLTIDSIDKPRNESMNDTKDESINKTKDENINNIKNESMNKTNDENISKSKKESINNSSSKSLSQLPMIEVRDLTKTFTIKSKLLGVPEGQVHAVNGINFHVNEGETLGLVGESGSGKSTTGRLMLRLLEPTSGKILLKGQDISQIKNRDFRRMRKDLQIVFQNPYSALDYKMTIEDILIQPLQIFKVVSPLMYKKEVARLLNLVGLSSEDAKKLPHEFSGGQRQRIGIARALATRPKFVVCDEPVSALDVSVQSQILNLTMDLQEEFGLSYLFIAHDLSVIRHVSHRVAVMYLGQIVEMGPVDDLFNSPLHPYTKALMSAAPLPDPNKTPNRIAIKGEIPSAMQIPKGCPFHTRCAHAMPICSDVVPETITIGEGRTIACHLYRQEVQL